MRMDRQVEFVGQHGNSLQGRVAHGVRRVRRERETHQGIGAQFVPRRQALAQVILRIGRVGRRELDGDDAGDDPHAKGPERPHAGFGIEVHVRGARRARPQHLQRGQPSAVIDELAADQRPFQRPHALREPAHQRQVITDATQQRHCRVGVRVDQARGHGMAVEPHDLSPAVAGRRVLDREHVHDASALDRDGMVFQHLAVRNHRNDPAAQQEGFDVDHGPDAKVRAITAHLPLPSTAGSGGTGNEGSG